MIPLLEFRQAVADNGGTNFRPLRHHEAHDESGGTAVKRLSLRREEGVAMTEFALVAPVFMLIVVGMLLFGRAFFYWIEANHLANETARWAVVDRNPYATNVPPMSLQQGARYGGQTQEFANAAKVCIDFPGKAPTDPLSLGDPVRVKVEETFEVFGGWKLSIRGSSTQRIERLVNETSPANYAAGSDPALATCT
jgi:hypothetical protein